MSRVIRLAVTAVATLALGTAAVPVVSYGGATVIDAVTSAKRPGGGSWCC